MKPRRRFLAQPKPFWANVRSISERLGYVNRRTGQIKVPSSIEIRNALASLGLESGHLFDRSGQPTPMGRLLNAYFQYRASLLNDHVRPRLMNAARAREVFEGLRARLAPSWPVPMNKQKGEKYAPAFLTGITNMLIEAHCQGLPCEYNPRRLTTITRKGAPVRTLSRWVDGAFPSAVNPIAVWEIKEYYYTTTFGSRVADGVYESLLDGMELEELREHERIDVRHYLIVDGEETWWRMGKSYLCRISDMIHMGYLDEALFGYEVVEEMPRIVTGWVRTARAATRRAHGPARLRQPKR